MFNWGKSKSEPDYMGEVRAKMNSWPLPEYTLKNEEDKYLCIDKTTKKVYYSSDYWDVAEDGKFHIRKNILGNAADKLIIRQTNSFNYLTISPTDEFVVRVDMYVSERFTQNEACYVPLIRDPEERGVFILGGKKYKFRTS